MKKIISVSIIILNYDGGNTTERCLNSVLKTITPLVEIILVDNGSERNEFEELKKKYAQKVKFIRNSTNLGYPAGNNLGAKAARGQYLIFLNNDTLVPTGWIEKLIQVLKENPDIAFLQPKIKSLVYKNYFEYAGGAGGYLDYFGFPFVRGRIFGSIEEDLGQYNDERDIFWASGVVLLCRKKVFEELGMFDPFFFSYGEEGDICFRAHRKGYRVVYSPRVEILHLGGFTSNRNIPQKIFYHHRNHLVLLLKNLRIRNLFVILPIRALFDVVAMFYYLYYYKSVSIAWVVVAAYCSLAKNLFQIIRLRYSYGIDKFGYPGSSGFVFRGSIIWDYFVLGKKRWSEIFNCERCSSKIMKIF